MKKKDKIIDFKKVTKDLENKRKGFLYNKFTKYIVDYRIEGDNIVVYSNIGKTRKVKNTRPNISKLNKVIVQNKIDIANKIDEYERESKDRTLIFGVNIASLFISGLLVPFSLFTGIYALFFGSIALFGFLVISSTMLAVNNYVLVSEIRNLKKLTGYKKEMEFQLPKINIAKTR